MFHRYGIFRQKFPQIFLSQISIKEKSGKSLPTIQPQIMSYLIDISNQKHQNFQDQMEQILLNLNKIKERMTKKEHIDEIKEWLYKAVRGVHTTFEKLDDVDSTSVRDFS